MIKQKLMFLLLVLFALTLTSCQTEVSKTENIIKLEEDKEFGGLYKEFSKQGWYFEDEWGLGTQIDKLSDDTQIELVTFEVNHSEFTTSAGTLINLIFWPQGGIPYGLVYNPTENSFVKCKEEDSECKKLLGSVGITIHIRKMGEKISILFPTELKEGWCEHFKRSFNYILPSGKLYSWGMKKDGKICPHFEAIPNRPSGSVNV